MNLLDLFVKVGVKDEASDKVSKLSGKLGSGLAKAAKFGVKAVAAGAGAVAALTGASVKSYADYEQLVGGAQLMFGDAYDFVAEKAKNAYKDVQMSQNDYLEQVNGFATGLKTALGGNTQAAAELADKIVKAEADVVAATGNTQENVQNAFNGIMKSNYTMLDNLQLGIKPTKEGFQELIDKVNEWNTANGEATNYQIDNLADAQSALVDYIEMQGLAGYAANEASETITGSLSSAKAAWQNMLTAMADDNADFAGSMDAFVESVAAAAGNLLPRFQIVLTGIGSLIENLMPVIIDRIPQIITETLPKIINSGIEIVKSLGQGIMNNINVIVETTFEIISLLISTIIDSLPQIIATGAELMVTFINELASHPDEIIETGIQLIVSLIGGLIEALPDLIVAAVTLIGELIKSFIDHLPEILETGKELIKSLIQGIKDTFTDIVEIGRSVVDKIKEGISNAWEGLKSWFSGIWDSLFGNRNVNVHVNKSSSGGKHRAGLETVPFDDYPALLHKGEMVLTAGEANAYRKGNKAEAGSGVTVNQYISVVPQTPVEFAAATTSYFEQARWSFA